MLYDSRKKFAFQYKGRWVEEIIVPRSGPKEANIIVADLEDPGFNAQLFTKESWKSLQKRIPPADLAKMKGFTVVVDEDGNAEEPMGEGVPVYTPSMKEQTEQIFEEVLDEIGLRWPTRDSGGTESSSE